MKYYQITVLGIAAFALGNMTHDYIPSFSSAGVGDALVASVGYKPEAQPGAVAGAEHVLNNKVDYKDGAFSVKEVRMKVHDYIAITNLDEKERMELVSDNNLLKTPRAYGFTERHRVQLAEPGTFTVTNKLNTKAVFKVTVEKPE